MINKMKVIILGGQGDGIVVASLLRDMQKANHKIELLGFLNDSKENKILGFPILGSLSDWKNYEEDKDVYFVTALLKTKYSFQRSNLIDSLKIPLDRYCNIIHPTATISDYSKIGVGNVIGPNVNIMPNVVIGNHCSFRASASIGHDCKINNFCYMGPNSTMAGKSILNDGAHIGPNASVLDGKIIGEHSILGMGSVATKNIEDFKVHFGVPSKKIGMVFK